MVFILVIFIVVAVITAVVSTSVNRFTNKTLNSVMKQMPDLEERENKTFYRKEAAKTASDKDIIDVAVANNGKVTATVLCARLDISVDEATTKLESLHNKGIFTLDNAASGHLVYMLVDLDLMR